MLSFQIIDIRDYHEDTSDEFLDEEDDNDDNENTIGSKTYLIRFFGRTQLDDENYPDKSVCLTVKNFTPFFFIKLPSDWNDKKAKSLYNKLKRPYNGNNDWVRKTNNYYSENLLDYSIREKFDFKEFTGNNKSKFLQLIFKNYDCMTKCIYLLQGKPDENGNRKGFYFNNKYYKFSMYESNINPVLKLMHIKEIYGSSWLKVSETDCIESNHSRCDLDFECDWKSIFPDTEKNVNGAYARIRVLSYDIEVMSSDPNGGFPQSDREGDCIIQIGMTYNYYQKTDCYKKQLICLDTIDDIENCEVISCDTERKLLQEFIKKLIEEDPDIICGYNIFGFDNKYVHDRSVRHDVKNVWSRLINQTPSKNKCGLCKSPDCMFKEQKLSSSAMGDNLLYYYESDGRVQIDLLKIVRNFTLENYKLDFVSSYFNQNKIDEVGENFIITPSTSGLDIGSYFHIKTIDEISGVEDISVEKYKVTNIDGTRVEYDGESFQELIKLNKLKWCMAKDDLAPKDIFRFQLIDSRHRAIIGRYCLKDCVLVNFLMEKIDVLSTNMAMSNVCWVPLYYIFLRGQGVKSFSLVAQQCRKEGYLIPTIKKSDFINNFCNNSSEFDEISVDYCTYDDCDTNKNENKDEVIVKEFKETRERVCVTCHRLQYYTEYEGAKVFEPKPGVYQDPISVLDYASLYPRSIISRNMSFETQVLNPDYDNLPGYKYYDVEYKDSLGENVKCRFSKDGDNLGIIPKILWNLLDERDKTKKLMKKEKDAFKKKILDGHQLALKITANSLYGQLGALTSPIYRKDIAACTTAVGQYMLGFAKNFIENEFLNLLNKSEKDKEFVDDINSKYTLNPQVVYGDTDSVFVNFNLRSKLNEEIDKVESRRISIKLGCIAGELVKDTLDYPHDLEYEKTFHPWLVLCKKKYAGPKYEFDVHKHSMSYMGIVLKRRDNAKIVKKICGGILNILFKENNYDKVKKFVEDTLNEIVRNKFDITYFVTTKTLRGSYKGKKLTSDKTGKVGESGKWNWDDVKCSLAHVLLCQRLKQRDPGSAPQVNDRVIYVNVYKPELQKGKKKVLQGECIEEISYVQQNNLPIDYFYYINNQIMNPVCQFLELIMENPKDEIFNFILKNIIRKRENKLKKKEEEKWNKILKVKSIDEDGFTPFDI